jgi:ribosomal protein L37E
MRRGDDGQRSRDQDGESMSFKCPTCGMVSYHPEDERQGYCGNCKDFTGTPSPRTRDEHLLWAKNRALEYLDAGDNQQAFTSMVSDLRKHPQLEDHPGLLIGAGFLFLHGWISNPLEVRRWIEGFN